MMAVQFFSGTFANADAGAIIGMLDSCLTGQTYWSVFDAAAGTNCKVYRCYDPSIGLDFFLYVGNNYSGYANIEGWTGWDADTHTGIGYRLYYMGSNAAYLLRIYCYSGYDWYITLTDHNFHIGHFRGHYFFGKPDEVFPGSSVPPVLFVTRGTYTTNVNPLGYGKYLSYYCDSVFLTSYNGLHRVGGWLANQGPATRIDGNVGFVPHSITYDYNEKKAVGRIHHCANFSDQDKSEKILTDGDIISVNGETWLVLMQSWGGMSRSLLRIA